MIQCIYINPPRRGPNENEAHIIGQEYKIRRSQFIRSLEGQWFESKEFPGYWEVLNANGKPHYYKSMDHSVIAPFNFPVIFYCTTTNLDINWGTYAYKDFEGKFPPQCGISSKWPDGHSLQMSFMRKHMQDATKIYQKVIELHDSLIINTSTPQKQ